MKILSRRNRTNIDEQGTYRVAKSPTRRVFYVDVGNTSSEQLETHLEQIKNEIRQKPCPSPDPSVKATGSRVEVLPHRYTDEQMTTLQRCAKDPLYFMTTFCQMNDATGPKLLDFDNRPRLAQLVTMIQEQGSLVVKQPRQAGVTITMVAYMLWLACFHDCKTIMTGSVKLHLAQDMRQRLLYMYEHLPHWLRPAVRHNNRHALELDNDSRIHFTACAENMGRGMTLDFCYLDSFAFVHPEVQRGILSGLLPCLRAASGMVIASTPNTTEDDFYQLWTAAESGDRPRFHAFGISYFDLPIASREHWMEMQSILGADAMRREYGGEFVTVEEATGK